MPSQAQCKACRQLSSKKNYSKRKDRLASDKDCQIAALKKSLIKKEKKIEKLLGKINQLISDFRG